MDEYDIAGGATVAALFVYVYNRFRICSNLNLEKVKTL